MHAIDPSSQSISNTVICFSTRHLFPADGASGSSEDREQLQENGVIDELLATGRQFVVVWGLSSKPVPRVDDAVLSLSPL